MDNETAGIFIKLIYQYQLTGEIPELDFGMDMAITPFINQFIRDDGKWDEFIDKQRQNGAKGGRPPKPKETQPLLEQPKETQKTLNVSNSNTVNVNDNKEPPITSLSIQSDKRNANHAYSDENFRALCYQKGIKEKEKLFEMLSGFLLHRAGNNFSESNSRDFRQHFMNWIGKSGHLHIQTKIANEQQQSHVPKADKAAIEAKYGRRNKDIPTG